MKNRHRLAVAAAPAVLSAVLASPLPAAAPDAVTTGGGGPLTVDRTSCITPAERAAQAAIDDYAEAGNAFVPAAIGVPPRFRFYPMAGNLYRELYTNNFVDLNNGAGLLDWFCGNHTYNGHRGNDTDIRSFAEQAIGVPIYAALDGTVIATHDGEDDMHTSCFGTANSVILDHGNGRRVLYWHLRNGSVAVAPGEDVRAGQIIGMTASSGCSTYPHLHFEVHDDGFYREPYAGPCRDVESMWVEQTPIRFDTYLRDFGITWENIADYPGLPFELPRSGQIALSDTNTRIWMIVHNLPSLSTRRWQFVRPNGTIAWTSPVYQWNNSEPYRWSWWWFNFNIGDMHSVTGTWHVRLFVNDELLVEAPIEVVVERDPAFNRLPAAVDVAFDPPAPRPNRALFARVDSDLVFDDLDWDVVRYEYAWEVDGVEVQRATHAGAADALPAGALQAGQTVTCRVTPSDGQENGPSVMIETVVGPTLPPCTGTDTDGDEVVGIVDLLAVLYQWGPCPGCSADVDGNGQVNLLDLTAVLASWGPCEKQ